MTPDTFHQRGAHIPACLLAWDLFTEMASTYQVQHVSHVPVGTVSPVTLAEMVDQAETNRLHVTSSKEAHLREELSLIGKQVSVNIS